MDCVNGLSRKEITIPVQGSLRHGEVSVTLTSTCRGQGFPPNCGS